MKVREIALCPGNRKLFLFLLFFFAAPFFFSLVGGGEGLSYAPAVSSVG